MYASNQPDMPAAPTGVTFTPTTPSTGRLYFTDASRSELRYVLQRSAAPFPTDPTAPLPPGTVEQLLPIVADGAGNTGPGGTSPVSSNVTGLQRLGKYYFRLRAENFRGASDWVLFSGTMTDQEPIPDAPVALVAYGLGDRNDLTFTDRSINEVSFVIERKRASDPETAWAALATVPGSDPFATGPMHFVDAPVDEGVTYSYRVRALNSEGESSQPTNAAVATQVGLKATIWDTTDFRDDPANPNDPVVRIDPAIDFDFNAPPYNGSPAPGAIGPDTYSIRWEGVFTVRETGTHVFYGSGDDSLPMGIDLDGVNILSPDNLGPRDRTASAPVDLVAGRQYTITVEYSHRSGDASPRLEHEVNGVRKVTGPDQLSREKLPLRPPTNVSAVNTLANCVTVKWSDNNNQETGYEVQRSTSPDFSADVVGVGTTGPDRRQLVDLTGTVVPGIRYYYRVRALGTPAPSPYAVAAEGVVPGDWAQWGNVWLDDFADEAAQSQWALNGSAAFRDADGDALGTTERLMLTDADFQSGSAFLRGPRSVSYWRVAFDFQVTQSTGGHGFAFVLQANDTEALGAGGAALGFGGMPNSFALAYNFYPNVSRISPLFNGAAPGDDATLVPFEFDFDGAGGADPAGGTRGTVLHSDIIYDYSGKSLTVSIDDLNNPATAPFSVTYHDVDIPNTMGSACAYVGFTGGTSNLHARQEIVNFQFGQVVEEFSGVEGVYVNGPGLTGGTPDARQSQFRALAGIDPVYGFPVSGGADQLKSIPWSTGINQVAVRFGPFVAGVDQGDLQVRGVNNATYPVSGFRWDNATRTGVWTLARPVLNDRLRLVLDDAGLPGLDGEWVNPVPGISGGSAFPSGNGRPGGDFDFRINILRGDVTRDGIVNSLDLGVVKQKLNKTATNPGFGFSAYSVFADLNADGSINALDLGIVKSRLNTRLPTAEPAATSLLFGQMPVVA